MRRDFFILLKTTVNYFNSVWYYYLKSIFLNVIKKGDFSPCK